MVIFDQHMKSLWEEPISPMLNAISLSYNTFLFVSDYFYFYDMEKMTWGKRVQIPCKKEFTKISLALYGDKVLFAHTYGFGVLNITKAEIEFF